MLRRVSGLAAAATLLAVAAHASTRPDPYKSARYVVSAGGRQVATADQMTHVSRSAEVVKHRAGGDPGVGAHKSPGRNKFEAVTLERGLTQDAGFADWAGRAEGDDPRAQRGPGRSLTVQASDGSAGYSLEGCWVSKSRALPKLGAGPNAVAIEHLELSCQRVTRLPRH